VAPLDEANALLEDIYKESKDRKQHNGKI